jgi:ATP-dependent exoDNAse (exonuclease V) alpha subunit
VAIYHLSAKVISRKSGRSSVAAAAYRSAGRLRDERQGVEHDFSRKRDVVHAEIMVPETAPDWMRDRDQLWNAVEAVERRKDAQLAREIEVALPRELDRDARLELVRGFVGRAFVARGMIADIAVHEGRARDGLSQPHAHVMLTMRELTGEGFGKKDRSWNTPDVLLGWREAWARDANRSLERAGSQERVDHRTLEVQRADAMRQVERARAGGQVDLSLAYEKKAIELDREPEPKIGASAYAQEKRGIATERGEAFRLVSARNAERQELGHRQFELRLELIERGRAFVASARERLENLWERAEAAMSRIRERAGLSAERGDIERDVEARRAAVLGRGQSKQERQSPDIGRERASVDKSQDQNRREAILGRHRGEGRDKDINQSRDRGR